MKKVALDSATNFMKSVEQLGQQEGLFAIIDLQHDLPTEWHKAMQNKADDGIYTLTIPDAKQFLPLYSILNPAKGKKLTATATDIRVFCSATMIRKDGTPSAPNIDNLKTFSLTPPDKLD